MDDQQRSTDVSDGTQIQNTANSSTTVNELEADSPASNNQRSEIADLLQTLYHNMRGTGESEELLNKLQENLKKCGILASVSPPTKPRAHLVGLPKELLDIILGHLLIDQESTTPLTIGDKYRPHRNYLWGRDLHISILLTCKTLYYYGSEFLYSKNTFLNLCGDQRQEEFHGFGNSNAIVNPITPQPSLNFRSIIDCPGISRVRRWQLIIATRTHESLDHMFRSGYYRAFLDFCRAVQFSDVGSVVIQVYDLHHRSANSRALLGPEFYLTEFLKPLGLLPASCQLILSDNQCEGLIADTGVDLESVLSYNKLKLTKDGDSDHYDEILSSNNDHWTSDNLYKMYTSLLRYAQSFERYIPFKLTMGFQFYEHLNPEYLTRLLDDSMEARGHITRNPFRCTKYDAMPGHPLERAILEAKLACDSFDMARFKQCRKAVVDYLEPQWGRIHQTSAELVDRIKANKGLILRNSYDASTQTKIDLSTLVTLLGDHLAAFNRDFPLETRITMLQSRSELKPVMRLYAFEHGDLSFTDCLDAVASWDCPRFENTFCPSTERRSVYTSKS